MAEIDFTKLPFDEAVALAMKEFDLGEEEATEFINLVHGKNIDESNISTKAGTSAGVKKSWLSRHRGKIGNIAGQVARGAGAFGAGALSGAGYTHATISPFRKNSAANYGGGFLAGFGGTVLQSKLANRAKSPKERKRLAKMFLAGMGTGAVGRALGPSIMKIAKARKHRYDSPMDRPGQVNAKIRFRKENTYSRALVPVPHTIKESNTLLGKKENIMEKMTYKAGNSSGVKKAWLSRKRGVTKFAGKLKIGAVGAAKKAATPGSSLSERVGKLAGRAVRGGAKGYGKFAKFGAKRSASLVKKVGKFAITKNPVVSQGKRLAGGLRKAGQFGRGFVRGVANKEYNADLVITKDANDKWRWTLLSTNAFEDNDKEVVSHKALLDDLEQSEIYYKENNNYGPLRWWHVVLGEDPIKDGLDIGTCDFRGMEDKIMVESGPFINEELGEALAPHAKELGGSIGFMHSTSEPDSDKVFHSIRIFERSLLPRERASNPLAQLIIQKEGGIMVKEKLEKLAQLLGGPDKAEQILGTAKEAQADAEAKGVRTKETDVVKTKDEGGVDASDEVTQEEWDGFREAVGVALEELMENKDKGEAEGEEAESKEYKEFVAAFKELGEGQDKVVKVLEAMDSRLKALEGEQPRGTRYEASTDKSNISEKGKHDEPKPDPMGTFVDGFVLRK